VLRTRKVKSDPVFVHRTRTLSQTYHNYSVSVLIPPSFLVSFRLSSLRGSHHWHVTLAPCPFSFPAPAQRRRLHIGICMGTGQYEVSSPTSCLRACAATGQQSSLYCEVSVALTTERCYAAASPRSPRDPFCHIARGFLPFRICVHSHLESILSGNHV